MVVPRSIRKKMKSRIHEGHLGAERSKACARQVLYWPGMSAGWLTWSHCETCLSARKLQQREPLHPFPPHYLPGTKLEEISFRWIRSTTSLQWITTEAFQRYVSLLPDTSSTTVASHNKSISARHGIPKVVISDNGSQYSCHKYRDFSEHWEFKHITSSPKHPQANGKAEHTIQTIKSLLKKTESSGWDPYLALLNFRTCPGPDGSLSPASLLMNRPLHKRLPRPLTAQQIRRRSKVQEAEAKVVLRQTNHVTSRT